MSDTYLTILDRLLMRVDDKYDKRESSVIYNALAPVAMELANVYTQLEDTENEGFADTASMYYLTRRAQERGIAPYQATAAVLKGRFSQSIEWGARFSGINTDLNYGVFELIGTKEESGATYYYYQCECEQTGEIGNSYIGGLIPIDGSGIAVAELVDILTYGEDAEDVEHFRQRYYESITDLRYGGNLADYQYYLENLPNVGGSKIYPAWNGGGTVKVVITNAENDVPDEDIVSAVQEALDPISDTGKGVGIAPIGHKVTVQAASVEYITVTATITYNTGYEWADVESEFNATVDKYLSDLNDSWGGTGGGLIVRTSQLTSLLITIGGVVDVTDVKINGQAKNYTAEVNAIVKRAVS